jgi:hypothetical protein
MRARDIASFNETLSAAECLCTYMRVFSEDL